jgi:23S rRNA (guanine745-N1)-methyltransferase
LRCPVCANPVHLNTRQLRCDRGHSFDIARQGYVNLTTGTAGPGTADTADMVAARESFLGQGHYEPLAAQISSLARRHARGQIGLAADLAGGTGYYLANTLDALGGRPGVCLDLSAPALRRAARAHPRMAAVGADVWRPLPLAAASAALVLSVFGPRNAAEISRVLRPGGTLIIAAPDTGHLRELRAPLGMIGIDERKSQRLDDAYAGYAPAEVAAVSYQLSLDHAGIAALVAMGPSARHIAPEELAARIRDLPPRTPVTVDLRIRVFRRAH